MVYRKMTEQNTVAYTLSGDCSITLYYQGVFLFVGKVYRKMTELNIVHCIGRLWHYIVLPRRFLFLGMVYSKMTEQKTVAYTVSGYCGIRLYYQGVFCRWEGVQKNDRAEHSTLYREIVALHCITKTFSFPWNGVQ